jgi:hypothetical protein
MHPLVNPATVKSWVGAPPFWISMGEEQFLDGGKAVARIAASQGVGLTWTVYEAMPHCFAALPHFNQSAQAKMLMERWGQFCRECVERPEAFRGRVSAAKVDFKGAGEKQVSLEDPSDLPLQDLEQLALKKIAHLKQEFRQAWKSQVPSNL